MKRFLRILSRKSDRARQVRQVARNRVRVEALENRLLLHGSPAFDFDVGAMHLVEQGHSHDHDETLAADGPVGGTPIAHNLLQFKQVDFDFLLSYIPALSSNP